jgi:hypothetical protein
VWKTLLHVAWLGILLGFVIEAILLSIAAGFGNFQSARPFVADLAQKISWSVIVCVGLAVGSAASKARDVMMGLMGLLAAPVAFYAARSIHKGAMQALSMSGGPAGGPSPLLLAIVKGVEYGCLGIALYWIQQRPWGGAAAHVGGGLVIGIVFAAVILTLTIQAALHPPSLASLIARGANEVIFPVGCALVIFSADVLGKRAQNV